MTREQVDRDAVLAVVERRRSEAGERYCAHQDQMDMEIVNEMDTIERLFQELPPSEEVERLRSAAQEAIVWFDIALQDERGVHYLNGDWAPADRDGPGDGWTDAELVASQLRAALPTTPPEEEKR